MKQKRQVMVLVALVAVAVLVWTFEWRQKTPAMQTATFIQDYKLLSEQNPGLRLDKLKRAQSTEYKSNGRNPFMSKISLPPEGPKTTKSTTTPSNPIVHVLLKEPTVAQVPANLKYFGYGTVPNGTPRRAFITDGDEVYIVSEGGTLMGRYRILKVGNSRLEFQEISSGLPGAMTLDEQAAPPAA